jgi:hypothetical protein
VTAPTRDVHGAAEVPLTQGVVALVDRDDLWLVSAGPGWHARRVPGHPKWYAGRTLPVDGFRMKQLMHRLILGLSYRDGLIADHINGDTLDNRRANLRVCSAQQNRWNSRTYRGSSRYRGVRFADGRWRAAVVKDGRYVGCTCHPDEVSAALSHDRMAREAFGEFACLNFPDVTEYATPEEIRLQLGRSSRFRGVTWHRGKWQAAITLPGRRSVYLGRFEREEDAAAARAEAERRFAVAEGR